MDVHVVHVVRTDNFAGVERYAAVLAATQASGGWEVTLVGGEKPAMTAALADHHVVHVTAGSLQHSAHVLNSLSDADLFHVHMTEAEAAALMAVGARRVPVIATRHFGAPRGKTPWGRVARPLIRRRIAAQIAVSRYVQERIDGPSEVVYPGVPLREEVDAKTRTRSILVAQRLESEKDTALALEAFALSGLAEEGWHLDVAGNGGLRPQLEARTRELALTDAVSFHGFLSDLAGPLTRCGILLATTPVEGFGLSVLEAMSWGTPVVAAAAGGHLETAGAASPMGLFTPGDADAAAQVLRGLAEDEPGRRVYGAELRRVQRERFTLATQAAGVETVYRKVL